ncbi:hypothetical protein HZ326_15064 [Fusarium oxysporum f. sp. albedinis]|nr:hypothetical protein HZ326_15064 [Fusarium oxysporum f. sp. albedinis]
MSASALLASNCNDSSQQVTVRYGVVANISRSHNLRDQFRGAQGSIPCTGVSLLLFLLPAWNLLLPIYLLHPGGTYS